MSDAEHPTAAAVMADLFLEMKAERDRLRAALDEAEARETIAADAAVRYLERAEKAEAARDALAAQLDAANALLRDGLLSVQTWHNEPIVIWVETAAAHLGAKP